MVDAELLVAMKALSDASRLRIIGLLAEGQAIPVEELARRLSLSPGTVVHHLNRLREARLVDAVPRRPYMDYSLRLDRLAEIGAALGRLAHEQSGAEPPVDAPPWAGPQEARVLRSFFEGERLTSIPAQRAKRLVVLRHLAETTFERKHKYPEKEVNQRLGVRHPDAASLRRYLVDEGFMSRKASVYRLRPRSDWPDTDMPAEGRSEARPGKDSRLRSAGDQRSRANASADTAAAPDS